MLMIMGYARRVPTTFVAFCISAIILLFISIAHADAVKSPCPFNWTRNLKVGSTGADVLKLQQFLNSDPDTIVASSGAGSAGKESNSYGQLTKRAITKFQEKYASEILAPNGLTKGTGVAGASTRMKLSSICLTAANSENTTPGINANTATPAAVPSSQTDTLTLADPGQPASSIAPANAGVPFLSFSLTAGSKDVTVRTIVIRRAGLGSDGALSSIGLYGEDGLQIGNIKSFDSKHEARLNESFIIPANTSQKFDVYVNTASDLSSYNGQFPHLEVSSIDASSPVSGTLPLRGSPQSINASLVVGSALAVRSSYDPGNAATKYINDTNVRFSGIRITADSKEDLTLENIIWRQSGTAGSNDITNVASVVNGKLYPATVRGRDYISFFEPGVVIKKGDSVDVYIQGDLQTSAANRTVKFDIYDNTDDVSITGNTYGLGVGISPTGNTDVAGTESAFITSDGSTDGDTGTPFYSGSTITVSGGAVNYIGRN